MEWWEKGEGEATGGLCENMSGRARRLCGSNSTMRGVSLGQGRGEHTKHPRHYNIAMHDYFRFNFLA